MVHEITHIQVIAPVLPGGRSGDGQVVLFDDDGAPDIVMPVVAMPTLGEPLPWDLGARVSIPRFGSVPRVEWRGPGEVTVHTDFTPVDLARIGLV